MPSSLLQVVNSFFQTCYNNWEQAVRTQLVDDLLADLFQGQDVRFLRLCSFSFLLRRNYTQTTAYCLLAPIYGQTK